MKISFTKKEVEALHYALHRDLSDPNGFRRPEQEPLLEPTRRAYRKLVRALGEAS